MGRPPQGKVAMTSTEHWRRWYAKQHPTKSSETGNAPARHEADTLRRENAALRAQIETLTLERNRSPAPTATRMQGTWSATGRSTG
jgi:hypothetical protein